MFAHVPIERVRAYWNRRPCNVRHSPAPLGTREYSDQVSARKYFVEPHIPRFAEFERWRGKRVLELGCGIGTDTLRFAEAGAEVTAVDLSERSLEIAQQRAEALGLTNITFVNANVEDLSAALPRSTYDLIYAFGVLHHTPHPERALAELRTHYAGPGTTFKLMLYHRYSYKVLWIILSLGHGAFWRAAELVARHSEAESGCPVTYTYSRRQVRELLCGLCVTDLWVDHIFPYRIKDYIQYRYKRAWIFRLMPHALMRALERRLGWHLCVTAVVP